VQLNVIANRDDPDDMVCINHPYTPTYLRCNRCDDPICTGCAIHTEVGYRCRTCVEEMRRTMRPIKRSRRSVLLLAIVIPFVFLYALFTLPSIRPGLADSDCTASSTTCTLLTLRINLIAIADDIYTRLDSQPNLDRAEQLAADGNNDAALAVYQELIDSGELSLDERWKVHEGRAKLYLTSGKFAQAERDMIVSLRLAGDSDISVRRLVQLNQTMVEVHIAQKQWSDALSFVNRALALAPDSPSLLYMRGKIHLAMDEFSLAVSDIQAGLEIEIESGFVNLEASGELIHLYYQVAEELRKVQRQTEAIALYTKALSHSFWNDKQRANLYGNRGFYYLDMDERASARDDLDQAIQLNPTAEQAYGVRAQLLSDQKQYVLAMADAEKTLQLCQHPPSEDSSGNDGCWFGYFVRAYVQLGAKEYEDVIADSLVAIELSENFSNKTIVLYLNLGSAYFELGKLDDAVENYTSVIELSLEHNNLMLLGSGYDGRANTYQRQGEKSLAQDDREKTKAIRRQLGE